MLVHDSAKATGQPHTFSIPEIVVFCATAQPHTFSIPEIVAFCVAAQPHTFSIPEIVAFCATAQPHTFSIPEIVAFCVTAHRKWHSMCACLTHRVWLVAARGLRWLDSWPAEVVVVEAGSKTAVSSET